MSNLYWLTDEQMARLEPYFPKSHGRPRVDDRRVLSGIVFVNRNGLRWCDAPKEYGPHKTLHNRWKRWGERPPRGWTKSLRVHRQHRRIFGPRRSKLGNRQPIDQRPQQLPLGGGRNRIFGVCHHDRIVMFCNVERVRNRNPVSPSAGCRSPDWCRLQHFGDEFARAL